MCIKTGGVEKTGAWGPPIWTPRWIEEKASAARTAGGQKSGKDRRMGATHMDPALDRRKGERRKDSRRAKDRRTEAIRMASVLERRKGERRKKIAWLFK
jgi:hypothetical protein